MSRPMHNGWSREKLPDPNEIARDALRYVKANEFIRKLNHNSRWLTTPQMHELRNQALGGDVDGAFKRMSSLIIQGGWNGDKKMPILRGKG